DPWVRQMQQLRGALRSLGLSAAAFEAPRALAQQLRSRFGAHGEALAVLLDRLEHQRYGRTPIARPDARLTRAFVAGARALRSRSG
ncbi:MAG: DUF3488 domain-containing protein, partial [Burkholderiales bacterium]|nr:DUF3488 domain-containing protein [Burkholderiales bacterium]